MNLFKKTKRKLKREFLFTSTVSIILLFVVVTSVVIYINAMMYRDEIYTKNGLLAHSLVLQLNDHTENQLTFIRIVADLYEESTHKEEKSRQLTRGLKYDHMYLKIDVFDNHGILIDTSSIDKGNLGLDMSNQPYIETLNSNGDYFYSNAFFSIEYDKVLVALSYRSKSHYYVVYLDMSHFYNHFLSLSLTDKMAYILTDGNETIIASSIPGIVESRSKISFFKTEQMTMREYQYIDIKNNVYLMNKSNSHMSDWTVYILTKNEDLLAPIYQMIVMSASLSLLMIIISYLYQNNRITYVIGKIEELNKNLSYIENGNYDINFADTEFVEFNVLSEHFIKSIDKIQLREMEIHSLNDNLEKIVDVRTSELSDKNAELVALVTELEDTQVLLIESEKEASFSRLIAGIAHEINTPIGVSITLSSYLIEATKKLEKAFLNNELTRKSFKEQLEKIDEVSTLILENLIKSGDLITSFKKASNNNFTYDLCDYNLYDLTDHLIKSMKTQIKDKDITIDIKMDEDFSLISFPSAMSQILTNLISNAITHGLKDHLVGYISISATKINNGKTVQVVVEDNGKGIPTDQINNIFEPFYTTNREQGGMGLGLSIIRNLVVNKLGGTISIESELQQHTRFILSIPSESSYATDIQH